jgi:NhaP-type Na+/H+ or K+/H+ antiporter
MDEMTIVAPTAMLLGNLAPRWGFISEAGDRAVRSTWEFITFLANSLVFLLIGLAEGHEDFGRLWWAASGAVIDMRKTLRIASSSSTIRIW